MRRRVKGSMKSSMAELRTEGVNDETDVNCRFVQAHKPRAGEPEEEIRRDIGACDDQCRRDDAPWKISARSRPSAGSCARTANGRACGAPLSRAALAALRLKSPAHAAQGQTILRSDRALQSIAENPEPKRECSSSRPPTFRPCYAPPM